MRYFLQKSKIVLVPYLHFSGECEEALNTYKNILSGQVEIVNRYNNPVMKAPDDYKNKALHAKFEFGGNIILASDVFPGNKSNGSGDAAMSLTIPDNVEAKKIFDRIAEGGKVIVPFEKQFWGSWHSNFIDRFGIGWMINCN